MEQLFYPCFRNANGRLQKLDAEALPLDEALKRVDHLPRDLRGVRLSTTDYSKSFFDYMAEINSGNHLLGQAQELANEERQTVFVVAYPPFYTPKITRMQIPGARLLHAVNPE